MEAEGSPRETSLTFVPFMMSSSVLWQVCEVGTLLEVIAISFLWVIVCPYSWKNH